jgi:hypothetical protein
MASSRLRMSHSRHGAITGKIGRQRGEGHLEPHLIVALAGAAVRERIGPTRRATSTCRFAIRGRAIAVPSRYFRL